MGLTSKSVGKAATSGVNITDKSSFLIALAGNPNVGKSTVFNELTGLSQHTGNWTGKTVDVAVGTCLHGDKNFSIVDIPGTYSLLPHSPEEEIARDFLCFCGCKKTVVVCDATSLERNLCLVLQVCEITPDVVVCVNLMDEARKKKISVDIKTLEKLLGIPVIATEARKRKGLSTLLDTLAENDDSKNPVQVKYPDDTEALLSKLTERVSEISDCPFPRFAATRILIEDTSFFGKFNENYGIDLSSDPIIKEVTGKLSPCDTSRTITKVISEISEKAHEIYEKCVSGGEFYTPFERRIDRIMTSRIFAFPIILLGLMLIFWLTIEGANYPSGYLSSLLTSFEAPLHSFLLSLHLPPSFCDALVSGIWRVLSWVVSVMLPPMAIFFPLFTLLEDSGILPRIAFNLDRAFEKCNSCGKQSLTMCMGFGCNAAGVVGARIISSPRERLIAILTNTFVPCNGKFPSLISVITIFFIGHSAGIFKSFSASLYLVLFILLGITATFVASKLLSLTLLRGVPSSFSLELPPYRRPQLLKVIVRSVFDRTLFVLGRAATVAAPAGLIIWLLANIRIGEMPLLMQVSSFLDPFARLLGLDGVILTAFILGFPANEIVLPLAIMAYTSGSALTDVSEISSLAEILRSNGWSIITAVSFILFSLMHWPCSTTLLTIKKETKSLKWTAVAFLLPTVFGIVLCMLSTFIARLFI